MAKISGFTQVKKDTARVTTETTCGWSSVELGGEPVLLLETYGSAGREIPGKVSQSIHLDRDAASELLAIIRSTFPGIN